MGELAWLFGIIGRKTKTLLIFPVDRRDKETLVSITERYVKKGSDVFTDGWQAYSSLNERGYRHFASNHSVGFAHTYRNVETGERVRAHTNTIEGAWMHAKVCACVQGIVF